MSKILGLDLSYHNGTLDFNAIKKAGVKWIIPRCSKRMDEDTKWREYVTQARDVGITVLGGYHFLYLNNGGTYENNAKRFIESMKAVGLSDAYYFVDVEYNLWEQLGTKVTAATANEYTKKFIAELIKQGVKKSQIVVYMNLDFYDHYYDKEVKSYPIWLADYTAPNDYDCDIYQFGSDFRIDGCKCNFDGNYLYNEAMLNYAYKDAGKEQTMGVTAKQILDTARGWLGYDESNGKWWSIVDGVYNNYIRSHKSQGRGYCLSKTDHWCAAFVSSCYIQNNAVDLIGAVECSVPEFIVCNQKKGIYLGKVKPQPGDIIFFDWAGVNSTNIWAADHIGLVEKFDASTGIVTTIEGNKSECTARRTIAWNSPSVLGYSRPKYATASSTTPATPSTGTARDVQWTGYICKQTTPKLQASASAGNMTTVKSADVNDKVGVCYSENGYYLVKFDKSGTYGFVPTSCVSKTKVATKSIDDIAAEVLKGLWGNGDDRRKKLTEAGYDYSKVQAKVNELCKPQPVYHTVASGETYASVCKKYGITVDTLLSLNPVATGTKLRVK